MPVCGPIERRFLSRAAGGLRSRLLPLCFLILLYRTAYAPYFRLSIYGASAVFSSRYLVLIIVPTTARRDLAGKPAALHEPIEGALNIARVSLQPLG